MKIQFPDDEIRNHDDRTGKYHDNNQGGAVNQYDDHEEGQETTEEDLDALVMAQEEQVDSDGREKQHQERMSRGYYPQQ